MRAMAKRRNILPGFGLTMGFTLTYLGLIVIIPLSMLFLRTASMGWGDYREQHECLLYGWIGEGHRRIEDRTQTTVWQIDREGDYQHPTQKPVALISRALRNSTIRGEVALDPFAGSGTTLIACEQLGRRCLALEIEPKYCDVIVQRWEGYTGKKAKRFRDEVTQEKVQTNE